MGGVGVRKGAWSKEEDSLLQECIETYGEGNWHLVPQRAELNRCRKSCRLRWLNYLSPNIKRGEFGPDEIDLLIRLHNLLGNRWSLIAGRLPGRTGNDVKNYWNTHQKKKKKKKKKKTTETRNESYVEIFRPKAKRWHPPVQNGAIVEKEITRSRVLQRSVAEGDHGSVIWPGEDIASRPPQTSGLTFGKEEGRSYSRGDDDHNSSTIGGRSGEEELHISEMLLELLATPWSDLSDWMEIPRSE